MKENTTFLAAWRVSKTVPSSSSVFMLPKNLSMGALSQQSPLRLIEQSILCWSSRRRYARAAYWLPRTPFCLSSGNLGLVYLASAVGDQAKHLTSDVAFQASDDLHLRMTPPHTLFHFDLSSPL